MTAQAPDKPLAGTRIWLTRPAHQSKAWMDGLEAAGGQVDVEPLLTIESPTDEPAARQALLAAEQADVVIATSTNAVRRAWRLRPEFAPRGTLCAVGGVTGRALQQAAGQPVQTPERGDTSETLLSLPELSNVQGRQIVLLSGEGGRKKLVEELRSRGARVAKAELYQRRPARIGQCRLGALITNNDAIVITSGEAMSHLCTLIHSCENSALRDALARVTVVVPSLRVVQLTPEDMFQRPPRVAERMTVDAVVAALAAGQRGAGQ